MAIVIFEHHPLETSARLGEILRDEGHTLRTLELYEGDPVPPDLDDVDGVISMGGPMNVDETGDHPWMEPEIDFLKSAHEAGLGVVGVCLGAQLVAQALGGEVGPMDKPEVGWGQVGETFFGQIDPLLAGIPWNTWQFHLHGQEVTKAPPGGTPIPLSGSGACRTQAFKVGLTTFGFQYHFELTRARIGPLIEANTDMIRRAGEDPEAIGEASDAHFDLHRHLGDRLCERIATLVFPIEHRLPSPGGAEPVAVDRPAVS